VEREYTLEIGVPEPIVVAQASSLLVGPARAFSMGAVHEADARGNVCDGAWYHARDGADDSDPRAATARTAADQGPPRLLLPRDVSTAGHQRTVRCRMGTRLAGRRRRNARFVVAASARHARGGPDRLGRRLRAPAGLVAGRPLHRVREVLARRDRSETARRAERRVHDAREQRGRQRGTAVVARRFAPRVRLDGIRRPMAHLHDRRARWTPGKPRTAHDRPRERSPSLLLQPLRSFPLAGVVSRWTRIDPRIERRTHLGHGRYLENGSARRRAATTDS